MGGFGWMNLIPQLPDFAGMGLNWAMGSKRADQYKSSVRHLRRREYQDMMFSMKKAGLNPMLASGATPGHSASYQGQMAPGASSAGVGSAIAANRQAGVAEGKAPSEIGLNQERAGEAGASAGLKREEALNRAVERTNLALQPSMTNATIEQIRAQAEKARQEAISEQTRRNLMAAQSSAARAAAKKAEMETPLEQGGAATQPYQAGKRIGAQVAKDVDNTASKAAETLGIWGHTMWLDFENWANGKQLDMQKWQRRVFPGHSSKEESK